MDLCDALIEWIKTFDVNFKSHEELSDGLVLGQILCEIIPEFFTIEWFSKLEIEDNNWRIRGSNLRIIYDKILDFYRENDLELDEKLLPNLTTIASYHDKQELGLLLQLIFGLALSCHNKNYFVDIINNLDSDEVKKGLMNAVKNLGLDETHETSHYESFTNSDHEMSVIVNNKCQELENALENSRQELSELTVQLLEIKEEYKQFREITEQKANEHKIIVSNLKQNLELMREELLTTEESKQDLRTKCNLFEKEVKELRKENNDFKYSQKNKTDENDMIRYLTEENSRLKETNSLHMNRIEEYKTQKASSKQSFSLEQIKIEEQMKTNEKLKTENTRLNKDLQELRLKLGEEIFRNDKLEDNYRFSNERCQELLAQNDKYIVELSQLKEQLKRFKTFEDNSNTNTPNISNEEFVPNSYNPFKFDEKVVNNWENELLMKENDFNQNNYMTCNETNLLKRFLQQKDIEIERLKDEMSKSDASRDREQQLMTLSYHKLCSELQRKSSEERMRKIGPTFLSKQRLSKKTLNTKSFLETKQNLVESQL